MGGVSWIAAIANLNVSAQASLPGWVRARGLAVFMTIFFGAMTIGSAVWGQVASMIGLDFAHFIAAAAALVAVLTWHWKLQPSVGTDLALSMHWPTPLVTHRFEQDQGPVLVTIEYRIEPSNRSAFLKALGGPAAQRRCDGAYAWNVFEDAAEEGRFLETFFVESWLSICDNTSASPMRIVFCRMRFTGSIWMASRKSLTSLLLS